METVNNIVLTNLTGKKLCFTFLLEERLLLALTEDKVYQMQNTLLSVVFC